MTIRTLIGGATLALAACQPAPPDDSRFGEGFDRTFDRQVINRPATPLESMVVQPQPIRPMAAPAVSSPEARAISAEQTAAETTALLQATAANSGVAPVQASPANPAPPVVENSAGISRENNFDAVSGQRTIEGDAAKLAANRAQYQVIQPEAVPKRTDTGPNIVAYAISTNHPVGTKMYNRFSIGSSKYQRNCGQYKHQDQAQIAFLAAGGPKKDPRGMDPDGDGYACKWDPSPYRTGG